MCLLFLYQHFFISKGYIQCTYLLWWSTYFGFLILLRACRAAPGQPEPVCLPAIQAPDHALNQITLKQVYSLLCLCPTRTCTPFSRFLGGGSGRIMIGWSCVVGGRRRRRRLRRVVVRFSCQPFKRCLPTARSARDMESDHAYEQQQYVRMTTQYIPAACLIFNKSVYATGYALAYPEVVLRR